MHSFQAGEVVCLKSGGPDMTIETVQASPTGTDNVTCVWFWIVEERHGLLVPRVLRCHANDQPRFDGASRPNALLN